MLCLTLLLNGCVYLIIGGVGAVGGYVISPDTVEGLIADKDFEEVWSAAVEVIAIMGIIDEQNRAGGMILARVQGAKVTVTMVSLGSSTVKLTIKARTAFLPKVKVAQEVYLKIGRQLNQ